MKKFLATSGLAIVFLLVAIFVPWFIGKLFILSSDFLSDLPTCFAWLLGVLALDVILCEVVILASCVLAVYCIVCIVKWVSKNNKKG